MERLLTNPVHRGAIAHRHGWRQRRSSLAVCYHSADRPLVALVATNIAAVARSISLDFIFYISVVGTLRFFVASASVRDLFLCAKHLFVEAMVAAGLTFF